MTADLVAWFTRILDELEEAAIAAGGDRWVLDGGIHREGHPTDEVVAWVYDDADEHIALNDPASALARIAADRQLLELHGPNRGFPEDRGICNNCPELLPCRTLLLLAQPYADRPGFQPDWKVS